MRLTKLASAINSLSGLGGPVPGVISVVAGSQANGAVSASSFTLSMSPTAGNMIWLNIMLYQFGQHPVINTISDTNSATWNLVGTATDASTNMHQYVYQGLPTVTGPTTITVTMNIVTFAYSQTQEFSRTGGTGWFIDGLATVVGVGGTSVAFPTLVPYKPGEMWIGSIVDDTDTTTAPPGFTKINIQGIPSITYKTSTLGNQTITVTINTNSSFGNEWCGIAVLVSTIPILTHAPTAPLNLTVVPGNAQALLSWTIPSNNGGATITSYNIYQSTTTGNEILVANTGSAVTSFLISSLTNATQYFFKVAAVNTKGAGTLSSEATVTPQTFAVPVNPDPNATGAQPVLPFPGSFYAQALPTNTPSWWSKGHMIAANSSKLISNFLSQGASPYSAPYAAGQTTRYVKTAANANQFAATTLTLIRTPGTFSVPLPTPNVGCPTGYIVGGNSDHEFAVWDQVSNPTSSQWGNFTVSGQTPILPPQTETAQFINGNDAAYPGFGPGSVSALSSSTAACGLPYLASMITWADFLFGTIKHMIFCAVGNPAGQVNPASTSDFVDGLPVGSGGICEGTIFTFPSSVSNPGRAAFVSAGSNAPDLAVMVFDAIKNYGLLVGDSTAGNGIAIKCEDFGPWNLFNPTAFPAGQPPYWMLNQDQNPFGEGAFLGMPWSSMVVLEPDTLWSPLVTDNNGATASTTLQDTQGVEVSTATTSITLKTATATNDMVVVSGMVGPTGTLGNTIAGLGATAWVKVYEHNLTYAGDSTVRTSFVWIGYGCVAGNTALTTNFTAAGDIVISRYSRVNVGNPIISSVNNNDGTTGIKGSFPTGTITTTALGQIVLGFCFIGYVELWENSFPAISELNYFGTSWTGGGTPITRHVANGINEVNSVFQDLVVPTVVGNISASMKAYGYGGYGGFETELVLISA